VRMSAERKNGDTLKTHAAEMQRIAEETRAFYEQARAASEAERYFVKNPLNEFWGGANMSVLHSILDGCADPVSQIRSVLRTALYSHSATDNATARRQTDWWVCHLATHYGVDWERLDAGIQESQLTDPSAHVQVRGRLLSPDFLRHLCLALEVKKRCALLDEAVTVLELGAGYGGFARVLKLLRPGACHVLIDIPETLYVAALFLRLTFPAARVCYVGERANAPTDVRDYDFVFVPTVFADVIQGHQYDLFYNTCSLGEMKNRVIQQWMAFIQDQARVRYFFGINRFLNTIAPEQHAWRLDENMASVSFDRRWRIIHWEVEPPFTRCPYHETFVTRNLEIVAERQPAYCVNPEADRLVSEQATLEVAAEDWYRYFEDDNSMCLRDNMLTPDLSMSGTLFKLWNAIRIHPIPENVALMVLLLSKLRRDKPFEEVFFYLDLFEGLQASGMPARLNIAPIPMHLLRRPLCSEVWGPQPFVQMVQEAYRGFNIVRWRTTYYAIAQELGPVDVINLENAKATELQAAQQLFLAESLSEAMRHVDRDGSRRFPELVCEGYRGFNIVAYGDRFYGLAQVLGQVDLTMLPPATLEIYQRRRLCFVGASLAEVKERVVAVPR
jgi:putative sugar O-methyltransferase